MKLKYKPSSAGYLHRHDITDLTPCIGNFMGYVGGTERGYSVSLPITRDATDEIIETLHSEDDWRQREIAHQFMQLDEADRAVLMLRLMKTHDELGED